MSTKKTVSKKLVKKAVKNPVVKKAVLKKKVIASKGTKGAQGQKAIKKTTVKKVVSQKPPVKKVKVGIKASTRKPVKSKKATSMKKPDKDLVFASDQESFWMQNGEILNSLMALNDAFAAMDKNIYQFHAHGDSNDFSIWVDSVLCDADCAADLAKAKTSKTARTIVVKHLKLYTI